MQNLADLIIKDPEAVIIATIEQEINSKHSELLNLNSIDRFGFCPLIQAVICKKNKVLKFLLKHGAKVDQKDVLGRTALQWAVERNALEAAKILLSSGADPNHYSLDGQPILVYPILRGNLELVELLKKFKANHLFAQDFISAKLLGHRFELTGEADIVTPNNSFIPLSFEGFYLEFSVGLIARSLYNFINSIPGQKFIELKDKFNIVLNALKNASILESFAQHKDKSLFEEHIAKIFKEKLLLLPSAYAGHAITFIKYKNYFAKCDRGVSNIIDTVIIYEIGNDYLCNSQLFYKLLYEPKTDRFINYELKQQLNLTPIKSLPTKNQIAGNCSFANVETSVPAMLYLLFEPDSPKKNAETEKTVYNFYKSWVEWDQDTALDEAITDFSNASIERKISKAMILGSILIQRLKHDYKLHINRAKKILNVLKIPNLQFILKNYIRIYQKPSAGSIGKNFIDLLRAAGWDQDALKDLLLSKISATTASEPDPDPNNLVKMTTALHVACLENNIPLVKKLLDDFKIDVNYLDRTGSTALMYAAWKGHLELVKLLVLKYHADPLIKNLKNGTAFRYAKYAGWVEIAKFLDHNKTNQLNN